MRDGEATVMVFIGDAPVEITKARMPKTFEKLVAVIDKANRH
jgi:hypothetical protein